MEFLQFQVKGKPELEKAIAGLEDALDTRAILDEGAAVLFNRMRTRFLDEVDPTGTPWPPSKAAIRRKLKGIGGGTLFATGRLFRSLQLFSVNAFTRAIGTDATSPSGFPYPARHNFGIGIVRRQFLGFNDDDATTMSDVVIRRLSEALNG